MVANITKPTKGVEKKNLYLGVCLKGLFISNSFLYVFCHIIFLFHQYYQNTIELPDFL